MKKHLANFAGSLFISAPVIFAFYLASHFMQKISDIPECTISAPREVPRCLPEKLDSETLSSLQDADNAFYEACVKHDINSAKKPETKYVMAMRGDQ